MELELGSKEWNVLKKLAPNWYKVLREATSFGKLAEPHVGSADECMSITSYPVCVLGEVYGFSDEYNEKCMQCSALSDAIGLFCYTAALSNSMKDYDIESDRITCLTSLVRILIIHMTKDHPTLTKRKIVEYNRIQKNLMVKTK